jgi:drug/metabolite transporter (DMT)-like permease
LFAIVALTWGGSFVAISIGLEYLPALLFAAARMYVAAAVVVPLMILWYDNWWPQTRGDWLGVLSAGVFTMGGSNAFLFAGQ